jgi:hypothetical protein
MIEFSFGLFVGARIQSKFPDRIAENVIHHWNLLPIGVRKFWYDADGARQYADDSYIEPGKDVWVIARNPQEAYDEANKDLGHSSTGSAAPYEQDIFEILGVWESRPAQPIKFQQSSAYEHPASSFGYAGSPGNQGARGSQGHIGSVGVQGHVDVLTVQDTPMPVTGAFWQDFPLPNGAFGW